MMWTMKPLASFVTTLVLLVPSVIPAGAQTARRQSSDEFSRGENIPHELLDALEETLQAGNQQMREFAFAQAEATYRKALESLDHPGLHYNLALALIQLDQPVEAHEHLVKALQGGEKTLGADQYNRALSDKKALEEKLAWVEFVCDNADAAVMAGGQKLSLVDGRYEGLMRSGRVTFKGTQQGYQPREKEFALAPGQKTRLRLRLYKAEDLIEYAPRWDPWKPWTAVGAGAVLTAGGGLLYWKARQGYRDFDEHVVECSRGSVDRGCREPDLASRRSRVEALNRWSFRTMAVGGAALITGTTLVLLNRSGARHLDPDELDRRQGLVVTPLLGGDSNGVLLTLQH
jgi:tetratricopeptide (TPR) repeat protein